MSLSKIVQESVSSFDKRFCSFNLSADERCKECLHKTFDGSSVADGCGSADEYIKEHLISSQISLLEAEKTLLEKKRCSCGQIVCHRNVLLDELLTYLTEQIELIKKMV